MNIADDGRKRKNTKEKPPIITRTLLLTHKYYLNYIFHLELNERRRRQQKKRAVARKKKFN